MGTEDLEQKETIQDIILRTLERQIIENVCWDSLTV